ncbi:hypothetical protein HDC30_002449 [Pseudomonas sp. JAI115]|uniref:hypothetical protein n=1 Tax=Pseudomonas sp. JAI115 TaxID=2723061 RepID=UPI001615A546|nr:hypothetical protein [Pseudomonas sp. JAI115]MBB6155226.1 hypothetical protein [Pseudomonas sp. JAI115]
MTSILSTPSARRFDTLITTQAFQTLLAPALNASGSVTALAGDIFNSAMLVFPNNAIIQSPPVLRAERIERALQRLFASDEAGAGSAAQFILMHRQLEGLKPVVKGLMSFLEQAVEYLQDENLLALPSNWEWN